jgi:hypothetical protein
MGDVGIEGPAPGAPQLPVGDAECIYVGFGVKVFWQSWDEMVEKSLPTSFARS